MDLSSFLEETEITNFSHPDMQALALSLSIGCSADEEIAKKCFLFVRDEIQHSGDYKQISLL